MDGIANPFFRSKMHYRLQDFAYRLQSQFFSRVVVVVVVVVVLVVVVVDLYSVSRSASNVLNVLLRLKKMSFQRRFEAVGTPSRVPE